VNKKAGEMGAEWNTNLYDAKHDFVWKYGADVVSLLDPRPGERILDLGCGTGHLTAQIAESGAKVLGVDRSAEMVAAARLAYPNLEFEISDATNLKFNYNFDAVSRMRRCTGFMNPCACSKECGERCALAGDSSRNWGAGKISARCKKRLIAFWWTLERRSREKCAPGTTRA
jgi:2-polyprenyl-3-methyl-5-hydroxy-6-metoxy-1,4-benzoquinol methylase